MPKATISAAKKCTPPRRPPSEQQHAEERSLEEGEQPLICQERREHVRRGVGETAPIGAELKRHDDAGDDAHPVQGASETERSRRSPSQNDTDVAGWRRVSCWSRRGALRPSSPAPNPRRRPIATSKPSTPAAADHRHCHTERRTSCWRRSSTPQVDLACSSLSTGSRCAQRAMPSEPPSPNC